MPEDYNAFEGDAEYTHDQNLRASIQKKKVVGTIMLVNLCLASGLIVCELITFIDLISSNTFHKESQTAKTKCYAINGSALVMSVILTVFLRCHRSCSTPAKYFVGFLGVCIAGLQIDLHFESNSSGLKDFTTWGAVIVVAVIFFWFWFQITCVQHIRGQNQSEKTPLNKSFGKGEKISKAGNTTAVRVQQEDQSYASEEEEAPSQTANVGSDGLTDEERAWRGDDASKSSTGRTTWGKYKEPAKQSGWGWGKLKQPKGLSAYDDV